jgi:hypothetical protein
VGVTATPWLARAVPQRAPGRPTEEVDIRPLQPDRLTAPDARVVHQQQDRRIPPVDERLRRRRTEKAPELIGRHHRHRYIGNPRRLDVLHRRAVDLFLLGRPAPELLQGAELD